MRVLKLLGIGFLSFVLSIGLLEASHAQYYVLDGFGGVHPGGGAPVITPGTTYFGFDIAEDIVYVPLGTAIGAGEGILVLDGFGGVHPGGALASDAPSPASTYFGFDIARAIAYRNIPPRANFSSTERADTTTTSTSFITIESTTLTVPDDGYVVISASTSLAVTAGQGVLAIGVDGTTALAGINFFEALPGTAFTNFRTVSVSQGALVSAGSHTFNFLLRARSAGDSVTYNDSPISAIYVDQDSTGASVISPPVREPGPEGGLAIH